MHDEYNTKHLNNYHGYNSIWLSTALGHHPSADLGSRLLPSYSSRLSLHPSPTYLVP